MRRALLRAFTSLYHQGTLGKHCQPQRLVHTPSSLVRLQASIAMGQTSSAQTEKASPPVTISAAWLKSSAIGKLCDPVDLSLSLLQTDGEKLRQTDQRTHWTVTLEVDVAHFQEMVQLCSLPAVFKTDVELVHISRDDFETAVRNVSLDKMCNVCAIHVRLLNANDQILAENAPIVMTVSHGSYNSVNSVFDLTRHLYGIDLSDEVVS